MPQFFGKEMRRKHVPNNRELASFLLKLNAKPDSASDPLVSILAGHLMFGAYEEQSFARPARPKSVEEPLRCRCPLWYSPRREFSALRFFVQ